MSRISSEEQRALKDSVRNFAKHNRRLNLFRALRSQTDGTGFDNGMASHDRTLVCLAHYFPKHTAVLNLAAWVWQVAWKN